MSSKNPKISIIVPVYNVAGYLKACIDSLINQSLKEIEIILVDDGSTDGSSVVCDDYANSDKRIKTIHKQNQGLGLARNSGLEIAEGDFIGFVDSDDIVSTEMFEILYANAQKVNADISYCRWSKFINDRDITNKNAPFNNALTIYEGRSQIRKYLLNRVGMPPKAKRDVLYGASVWCGIFKRELIKDSGIKFVSEREFVSEDIIFDIDVLPLSERIVHTDNVLYFYRFNPDSLTAVYKSDRFNKNIALYFEMERKLRNLIPDGEYRNSLMRYFITFSRIAVMQEVRFIKKNGRKNAKSNIKVICENAELKIIFEQYPWMQLPLKYRIFCFCQKHCLVQALIILCRLKN